MSTVGANTRLVIIFDICDFVKVSARSSEYPYLNGAILPF